jgi:hypothetical protein
MSMSDVTDIKIDVDAHLCVLPCAYQLPISCSTLVCLVLLCSHAAAVLHQYNTVHPVSVNLKFTWALGENRWS